MKPRIYADFNKIYVESDSRNKENRPDDECRVVLKCIGTMRDLKEQDVQLSEGLELALYMPDHDEDGVPDHLEVDVVVEINASGEWVGRFRWGDLKYQSEK